MRFVSCAPFLKELFNGDVFFIREPSFGEAPHVIFKGDGFLFFLSAEFPELSLPLRLPVRAILAILAIRVLI